MTLHEMPPLAVDDVDFQAMTEGQRAIVSAVFYGGAMAYLQVFDSINPIANVIANGDAPGVHPDGLDANFFLVLCRVISNGFAAAREQMADIASEHAAAIAHESGPTNAPPRLDLH